MVPQGQVYINGKDLFTIFSIIVESGLDGFLKIPSAKDKITRNWSDRDGIDVDLSAIFLNSREVTLRMAILADSEDDFWVKYNGFIAEWKKSSYQRIQVKDFGLRSFYCFYKDSSEFSRFTKIQIDDTNELKVACKFSISLVEGEPNIGILDEFIVDEEGRFLIT